MGSQVGPCWRHFRCFSSSCFRGRCGSRLGGVLEASWGSPGGSKSSKNLGGLLKISIFGLSLRSWFQRPRRAHLGGDPGPKLEPKSLPKRLPKRASKQGPKRTVSRAPKRAPSSPQTPPRRAQDAPKTGKIGGKKEGNRGILTRPLLDPPRDPLWASIWGRFGIIFEIVLGRFGGAVCVVFVKWFG